MDKAVPTPYSHQGEPEAEAKRIDDYMNNEEPDDEMPQSLEEALLGE
tara:strand:- start:205 stop:345 length:141 start_codon:yes stop_codon:yes gene_type:complete